jgi:membrane protease YdiL (CAAX protease family)
MQVKSPSIAIRSALRPIGPLVHALEAGTVFFLLLSYIWYFQTRVHWSWMILLGLVLLSHAIRGESPVDLGLRKAGFRDCMRKFAIPVVLVAATGTILGFALDTVRDVEPWRVVGVLSGYCFWALFQQYLLNGYFVNRIHASFHATHEYVVALIGGALFAAAHVPNTLLMVVTLIGGTVAAAAYLRHRNLLFLAFAHALIGTMLWLVVPDTVSHHLRVGPGMRRAHGHSIHRPSSPTVDTLNALVRQQEVPFANPKTRQ